MFQSSQAQALQREAASLLLYQSVLTGAASQAFLDLIQALIQPDMTGINCLWSYGQWFQALASTGLNWQDYLLSQILKAENPFVQQAQRSNFTALPPALVAAAQHDLQILQRLYQCDSQLLSQWVQSATALETAPIAWEVHSNASSPGSSASSPWERSPIWDTLRQAKQWSEQVESLAAHYRQFGSGLFAAYSAFRWQSHQLVGVAYPDPIQLSELVGYELQKTTLQQNTEALLAGYPALHVLLYGSRGSGKSSLIKALLSTYSTQGLRLVEVGKAELQDLPTIVNQLRDAPQKFIIFVDDLSFEEDDDAYKALKVVLEGNITARPQNIVVYATSNRRHLIREFFADRPRPSDADEIHNWDTVQEKLSFSDRFGLTLTFEPANQDTYLQIVSHLADQAGLRIEPQDLEFRALQWATRHNGRSGRTARQFIDFLRAETGLTQQNQ
ncbi:MAG TPA: ATP-binding protein [Allocoleopsis sp.]